MGLKSLYFIFACGSLLVIGGTVLAGVFSQIFAVFLNKVLVIDENSKILDTFQKPPMPVFLDFYFFNVTNPTEVLHYGAKPIVEEVGPYSYKEEIQRSNFTWFKSEGTVHYRERRTYFFDISKSSGTEQDIIITLNTVMVVAAALGYNNLLFKEIVWPEIESGCDLFESFTVGELLFEGWSLPTFDFDFGLNETQKLKGTLYEILMEIKGSAPEALRENRFGFYFGRNGSTYADYHVKTGETGMADYLHITKLNNKENIKYWNESYCNMINGTDGTQFPPHVNPDRKLRLFTMDLCRSIYLQYEKDVSLHYLSKNFRFIAPEMMLQEPAKNPDNRCFCQLLPTDDQCLHDSMLNLAPCYQGAPIVVSTPHFYQGNITDLEKVDGLNPVKEKHETFLDLEPNMGLVVNASKKIQLNLPLRKYSDLPSFINVPELIFPILWANEHTEISKEDSKTIHETLTKPFTIAYSISGVVVVFGLVLILYGIMKKRKKNMLDQQK